METQIKNEEPMEVFIKQIGSSSKGEQILITSREEVFAFSSNEVEEIKGLEERSLWAWLGNNLRLFTPAKMKFSKNFIELNFYLEEISFKAKRIEIPSWANKDI